MWPPPMAPWTSPQVGEPRQRPNWSGSRCKWFLVSTGTGESWSSCALGSKLRLAAQTPSRDWETESTTTPLTTTTMTSPSHRINHHVVNHHVSNRQTQAHFVLQQKTQKEERAQREERKREGRKRKNRSKWEERKKIKLIYSGTGDGEEIVF